MKQKGRIFIISGPSGVGKTTIAKKVLNEVRGITRTVSVTTRKRRKGERNGYDYRFVTKEEFRKLIEKDAFLEWAQVLDNFYGTLEKDVEQIVQSGKDALLCIDVQGAEQVRDKLPEAISIFVLPPSLNSLRNRLIKRGDSREEVEKRLDLAHQEMEMMKDYNYWVINDVLQRGIKLIKYIINAERHKIEGEKGDQMKTRFTERSERKLHA